MNPSPLRLLLALAVALAAAAAAAQAPVPPRPSPPRLVNDYAGLLAPAERDALERKLVAFDDSTSTQIAVVAMPTLDGADAATFATALGEAWGVGDAAGDNGIVVLVSVQDRQVFIATGYGVEGAVPDAIAARIVRELLVPAFREGRFYAGLDAATDALMAATRGEYTAAPRGAPGTGLPVELIVLLVILAVIISSLVAQRHHDDDGRGRGRGRRRRGGPGVIFVPWGWSGGGSSGGWSSGGGGFSGGGFSGGGFGGFGGGSFGGGGAGGSW